MKLNLLWIKIKDDQIKKQNYVIQKKDQGNGLDHKFKNIMVKNMACQIIFVMLGPYLQMNIKNT